MTLSHNLESRRYVRKWLVYHFVELLLATLEPVVMAVPANTKSGRKIFFITLVFIKYILVHLLSGDSRASYPQKLWITVCADLRRQ